MKAEPIADYWIEMEKPATYHGWPTILNAGNDRLMIVCSGNRQGHICPFGRVYLYTSEDGGRTWSAPVRLSKGPLDDRDAGIIKAQDGSLLVNYFTSIRFLESPDQPPSWETVEEKTTLADLKREHGFFMVRSTDGGRTWSEKYAVPVNNVHGPALLNDGSLLWVGREIGNAILQAKKGNRNIAVRSTDNGLTWQFVSELPVVPGQRATDWHEFHAVQAPDGTVIAQFRNHTEPEIATWQTESRNGGLTWTIPHYVCYGFPTHLLNLPDGRILMAYGYRKEPYGNRFRISSDNGKSWSGEAILSDDGEDWDLGYPSSALLSDGSIVTAWYQSRSGIASLRVKQWRLA